MKTIKILMIWAATLLMAGCMNDFDTMYNDEIPYGNNAIGNSNTTIAQLKTQYATIISNSYYQQITDSIIIKGVVVCNDESGNVYKQFVISDGTGAIIIGVNTTGLYASLPVGQMIVLNCKGLYVGGYGKLAQIGDLYNSSIGRMPELTFKNHVKLIGSPTVEYNELTPLDITQSWLTTEHMNSSLPVYAKLSGVKFDQADGKTTFAPDPNDGTTTVVSRTVKLGTTPITFRFSTYANFANDTIPTGALNITGVLTRFNNYWQFMLGTINDITLVK